MPPGLELKHFFYTIPIILMLLFMLIHEDLSAVAIILILCMSFVGLVAYFSYSDAAANISDTVDSAQQSKHGRQLAMMKVWFLLLSV